MTRPWLVLREGERRRWGGDLRRRYLLDALAERVGAIAQDDWRRDSIARTLRAQRGPRWQAWRPRSAVATTEVLPPDRLGVILDLGDPVLVDIHDEPLIQAAALGLTLPEAEAETIRERLRANLAAFRFGVAQSDGFMRLAGMDPGRTIVAANGADPDHIRPMPLPDRPVVGYASGAAPGRGIELLVEAAGLARREVPDLILRLWLVPTGDASAAYLEALRRSVADRPWVEIGPVDHADLSAALGSTRVLCVPNPANPYWDTVLPIKLFDSMAAGRPVVVTPRVEMAAVVQARDAGLVMSDDSAEAMADALVRLLRDRPLAERLGRGARTAIEERYSWPAIGSRLADDLLARMG